MRVHTLALLALAAMGLTSVSVWHLVPSTAEAAPIPLAAVSALGPDEAPADAVDPSRFVAGQTLLLEGRLGHPTLPAGQDRTTYLLATVNGADGLVAQPAPLDLAIVVDTSGSMRGARLNNAVEAARGMVRRLRDQDRVTVITYSTRANVLVPFTVVDGFSRERVIAAIAGMQASGNTCISCGIDLALSQTNPQVDRVSRILLLSDGEATSGVQSVEGFRNLARQSRVRGTTLSTIGVDIEYNERVMSALAQFSNGRHYFVQHPHQLAPVFERELDSLSQTLANDVELVVDLADGVRVERVFDREVQQTGNRMVVQVGTVTPGVQKTLLVQLRVPAGLDPERPVANLSLRYQDLVNHRPGQCEGALAARVTTDASEVSELDPFVAARVSRSVTLNGIRTANEQTARGQFGLARGTLQATTSQVDALSGEAMAAAEPAAAPRLEEDFQLQRRALSGASGGVADPGLSAPAASREGSRARRRAATQQRANADLSDPFAF